MKYTTQTKKIKAEINSIQLIDNTKFAIGVVKNPIKVEKQINHFTYYNWNLSFSAN